MRITGTFLDEISHFLSPNSCYLQAHHLYRRYCEHFGLGAAAVRFL
jgi:hypothetical protein